MPSHALFLFCLEGESFCYQQVFFSFCPVLDIPPVVRSEFNWDRSSRGCVFFFEFFRLCVQQGATTSSCVSRSDLFFCGLLLCLENNKTGMSRQQLSSMPSLTPSHDQADVSAISCETAADLSLQQQQQTVEMTPRRKQVSTPWWMGFSLSQW